MDTTTNLPTTRAPALAYRLLRYAPKAVRDEWINIGVLVFAQHSNDFRLRRWKSTMNFRACGDCGPEPMKT